MTTTEVKPLSEYRSDYETGTVMPRISVWSYHYSWLKDHPYEDEVGYSGESPAGPVAFCKALVKEGHAIVKAWDNPAELAHHYTLACRQIPHQDAEFAEAGKSHAAWVENNEGGWDNQWWTPSSSYRPSWGNTGRTRP